MNDDFSQKSLQKMKQKLQSNMPKISAAELKTGRKSGLSKAFEAMSDEIIAMKNRGLSYNQIASELEKVGLKTKGGTIQKYFWDFKNKNGNEPVAAPAVKPVAAPVAQVIIKPATTAPAAKYKAPVAGSKEFDELGF